MLLSVYHTTANMELIMQSLEEMHMTNEENASLEEMHMTNEENIEMIMTDIIRQFISSGVYGLTGVMHVFADVPFTRVRVPHSAINRAMGRHSEVCAYYCVDLVHNIGLDLNSLDQYAIENFFPIISPEDVVQLIVFAAFIVSRYGDDTVYNMTVREQVMWWIVNTVLDVECMSVIEGCGGWCAFIDSLVYV